jgi:hypothetical protein
VKRTPKNYDGVHRTTKQISDLLPAVLAQIRKKSDEPVKNILQTWSEVVGAAGATYTEAVSFDEGVLTVVVKSSTLYSLLHQSERPRLLRMMRERFPEVQAIRFRRG